MTSLLNLRVKSAVLGERARSRACTLSVADDNTSRSVAR
jgi:hypothetical protein